MLAALIDFLERWSGNIQELGQGILGLILLFLGLGVLANAGILPAVGFIATSLTILEFFAIPTIVGATVLLAVWALALLICILNVAYKVYSWIN